MEESVKSWLEKIEEWERESWCDRMKEVWWEKIEWHKFDEKEWMKEKVKREKGWEKRKERKLTWEWKRVGWERERENEKRENWWGLGKGRERKLMKKNWRERSVEKMEWEIWLERMIRSDKSWCEKGWDRKNEMTKS